MKKAEAVRNLYSQRDTFILIGLTGRTGSGCTTVADILSKESMDQLDLRSYKTCDYNDADERKYSIIYRYMKEGKKWKRFTVIEASSVIFSFVLEGTYKDLFDFIAQFQKKGEIKEIDNLKKKIARVLDDRYRDMPMEEIDLKKVEKCYIDEKAKAIIDDLNNMNNPEGFLDIIQYFTVTLKEKKNKFRDVLKNRIIEKVTDNEGKGEEKLYNLYTYFMQMVGNNIRSSGEYYTEKEVFGKEITVAERINKLIYVIKEYEKKLNNKDNIKKENGNENTSNENRVRTRICIDALRNSIEIQYFRDRYRAFYVFAVNTENEDRQERLQLNKKEMQTLDEIEYPHNNSVFYHQNIQACLEISDIYLYNPHVSNYKYYDLSEQIIKYIALILQPGLVAPTSLERCMQLAFNAKYNSGCLSRQVGAVVTGDDFAIRSVGWNDVPKGQISCNLRCVEDYCRNKDNETFSEYELSNELFYEVMQNINDAIKQSNDKKNKSGKYYAYCFKDIYNGLKNQKNQVYTRALHAEENAFLQLAKYGGSKVEGGKLFTTSSPCELCSKKAYQLGVKEIYYIDPYPGISKSHILSFGKDDNPKMILFQGAIGNAYISLYAPRMPYKDEIALITGVESGDIAEEIYKKHKDDR